MNIEDMTIEQLLEINQIIGERIDELCDRENLQAFSALRIGLKVTFDGRRGWVMGTVIKIHRKSVIVLSEDGVHQYKVPPGMLRLLRDVK